MATTIAVISTETQFRAAREETFKGAGYSALGLIRKTDGTLAKLFYDPVGDVIYQFVLPDRGPSDPSTGSAKMAQPPVVNTNPFTRSFGQPPF